MFKKQVEKGIDNKSNGFLNMVFIKYKCVTIQSNKNQIRRIVTRKRRNTFRKQRAEIEPSTLCLSNFKTANKNHTKKKDKRMITHQTKYLSLLIKGGKK